MPTIVTSMHLTASVWCRLRETWIIFGTSSQGSHLNKHLQECIVRGLRWADEPLCDLEGAGANVSLLTRQSLLRECNAITIDKADELVYLRIFFDTLFSNLAFDI